MSSEAQDKQIILKPSWKHFFIGYLLSVLAIPLFGVGLIALYFIRRKHTGISFAVRDTQISSTDTKYHRNIDLVNIEKLSVQQNWLQKKLGIGTIVLKTSAVEMNLIGMEQPFQLQNTIQKAIAAQQQKQQKQDFRKHPDPKYKPGTMEKMDYLTGLWQQGLLSDEDFEDEKKNFE